MRRILLMGLILSVGLLATTASAGVILASATESSTLDPDGINHDYTLILSNSSASTDGIGTFWFAWKPGQDFMANSPISETSPTGWAAKPTGGGPGDGHAIQWVASNAASDVAIGSSLTFRFKSAETPAQLAGNSPFFPTTPEMTSVLYNAAPFSADSATIVVTPLASVPEPSTMILTLVGGLAAYAYKRLKC